MGGRFQLRAGLGLVLAGLLGCSEDATTPQAWAWELPDGFPVPAVPDDNPMTVEKVTLGHHLFYEQRLSGNETQSCASCHLQELAFTDGLARAIGSTGEEHPRNAMGLVNTAYVPTFNWANPVVRTLQEQALTPMFGDDPVELGLDGETMRERLAADEAYQALFEAAYPEADELFTVDQVAKAIASFERTIVSADAPYDRYLAGDTDALGAEAREGIALFFSEKFECFHCHGGFNLSSAVDHEGNVFDQSAFFNNGLYDIDGEGTYPLDNQGLFTFTGAPADMGKFRPPSLRNVELTAPYMHDGSIATLEEVLEHYARGGRLIESGPDAGDGKENPYKNDFVAGFEMSEREKTALLAFLRALTDTTVATDPRFADPGPP